MADDRLIEIMAELLAEVHQMRVDMNARFGEVNSNLKVVELRVATLEKQQAKTNMELSELRLSNMKIAERLEKLGVYESRILRLEDAVFRKAS